MIGPDALALACALGGGLGAFAHAIITTSRPALSRMTAGNVIGGFLAGLLLPSYMPDLLPAAQSIVIKAGSVAFVTYVAGDSLMNLLVRAGKLPAAVTAPAPEARK